MDDELHQELLSNLKEAVSVIEIRQKILDLVDENGGTLSISETTKTLAENKQLSECSVQDGIRSLLETGPLELGDNMWLVHKK